MRTLLAAQIEPEMLVGSETSLYTNFIRLTKLFIFVTGNKEFFIAVALIFTSFNIYLQSLENLTPRSNR